MLANGTTRHRPLWYQEVVPSHFREWALALSCLFLLGCSAGTNEELPYDKTADPHHALEHATNLAQLEGKDILLVFGANWCPDCRRLHQAMRDPSLSPFIEQHFVVMHVDVGNWDHNLGFVQDWGDPIRGGIPAVVLATAEHEVIYRTDAGELATARHKGLGELRVAFSDLAGMAEEFGSP